MVNGTFDTNVLLDWLLDRDSDRTAQIQRFLKRSKRVAVPDAVIIEVIFVLEDAYRFSRSELARNLATILNEPQFQCNRSLFLEALTEYVDHPSFSFVDCYLLQVVEIADVLPLWTFDKKLVNQSGGRAKLLK